jgi:formylglycine-generating enzyme required for sulfatase activity
LPSAASSSPTQSKVLPLQSPPSQVPLPKPIKRGELNGKKPLQDPLQIGDAMGPEMVVIPAGTFMMGSTATGIDRRYRESPEHRVSLASFAMSRTEITFDDYDRFARATKRRMADDDGQGRGTHPVVDVNWIDATEYGQWLTAQTGFTYRLPSEAEWEYAARAGGKAGTAFSTGGCISAKQANFNDTAASVFNNCPSSNLNLGKAQPVASYAPNAFGLHDMHGNVFEWTADCVHLTYERAPSDGRIWLEEDGGNCGEHMVRGGSWQSGQISVRSSLRAAIGYADASGLIGFRIVRELAPPQR